MDSDENAYVVGTTHSADFPTKNPLQAANHGNGDSFVAKLNTAGSALLYSTNLGGSNDDAADGIAVDGQDVVHCLPQSIARQHSGRQNREE